ncbi:MAG TPA: magnesium transporter, partial [Sutterella sp.]|nr:magnesium transporter [Sutterella sp.]
MRESELEKKEPAEHSPDTGEISALAPEEASLALSQIAQIFEREEQSENQQPTDPNHPLAKPLSESAKGDLREILRSLHPADVAYVLEALPPDDRLAVWQLVDAHDEGDVLVEVSDGVRETLIEAMTSDELVDAVETLDTDEIADIVQDLPPDVVAEVQEGLSSEERAQLRAAMSYP